ncbi:H /K ATPase alpha subunit, putative [Talaromyces stipitatus ATCC 10500]|uniref:H /K ATPase alpha subunit, putative n=1 Tax=Talaromyces stipitatus (strain ATCC 10500 / CBS 375.48 / QM 6759 / NRRL 1006) TaxID=441959 RepID=B8MP33_TALSN|nr:H /K ATPase alpha subunit, putative [Talaromyces stipitatus ATCC 10500]EED14272.1 H /K ATPase alpha subunit, putative [Talaromyces stipitatus ATCC 10500]
MADHNDAENTASGSRLKWEKPEKPDEETGLSRPQHLTRTLSTASSSGMSTRAGRRGTVDPAVTLPIHYRSLSFDIDEVQQREEIKTKNDGVAIELSNIEWHTLSIPSIEKHFQVDISHGLSPDRIHQQLRQYGKNVLSPLPHRWFLQIFGYFFKGFGIILLIGCILVFVSWKPLGDPPAVANLALAIVLLAVFFIQAAFNAWQDWSSSRVMASITAMLPENCTVIRNDGNQVSIPASEIVPGDVIRIKAGNKLPADVRFVHVESDACFDRSILTGESLPVSGTIDATEENYLETQNIGLQGTHCVSGSAVGIVVSTGDNTVFGRIAKLASEPKPGLTLLEKEVLRFVALIVLIMLTMIIVVAIVWATWLRKDHPGWINVPTLIVDCVSVAIAFIPEGLPISITASLTITANIMRKNQILCKSLKTVETLGSVSVICSDKTGTLTKNKMFVTDCAVSTSVYNPMTARDDMVLKGKSTGIHQLRALSGLCNAAEFDAAADHLPLNERPIFGDATDQAILRFSEVLGSVTELRRLWKKTWELAFNSKNKFMIRTFAVAESKGLGLALSPAESVQFKSEDILLTIKGAPDILIERCGRIVSADGSVQPLDAETLRQVRSIKDEWSNQGKRVILLARKVIADQDITSTPGSHEYESEIMRQVRSDLILVGLVGIVDPPREEIPDVVKTLRRAGIRIFMVTGDFGLTALAIARQCGIISGNSRVDDVTALQRYASGSDTVVDKPELHSSAIVISGPELLSLNETQWDQLCKYREIVFARTTPEQKLRIVREFQSREEIVGMTGDGVNDAPSLKAADIGIALGSGSDIAIEASDMVLLDSFSAIVEAVQYGRVVFDNLKKTIIYLLPAGSFSEFWPVFTNVVFGLPQVLSSFLMIVICCFTDCAAATVLAYEKPEADVLLRPPRNPRKDKLVDWRLMFNAYGIIGVIQTVCSFSMSYWYLQRNGIPFSSLWFGFGAVPDGIDQDYYSDKLNEASSIYFINLVVMQWFNLMAIRTRRLSIFSHPPAFNKQTQNLLLFPAILFALGIAAFWLYIPRFQSVLGTTSVPAEHYFLPAAFGLGLLILDEGRKAAVRRWPGGVVAKLAW